MTKTATPRRVNPGTSAMLLGAVLNEVETLRDRVDGHDKVLAPAFTPPKERVSSAPMRDTMTDIRGPGVYPRELVVLRQASSNGGDIWAGDVEHSPAFMEAVRKGGNIADLRRQSAEHALMQAITRQPNPVLSETPVFCGQDGCRPATQCPNCRGRTRVVTDDSVATVPPRQSSVTYRQWNEFPDHQDPRNLLPEPPPHPEPGAMTPAMIARQQAAAMPPRQPEGGQVLKGLGD